MEEIVAIYKDGFFYSGSEAIKMVIEGEKYDKTITREFAKKMAYFPHKTDWKEISELDTCCVSSKSLGEY